MKKAAAVVMVVLMMLSLAACQKGEAKNVPLNDILEAVKAAYGEDYLPQMPYDATALEQQFGLTQDMYEEAVGEAPMISTHVDTFVAVKAKPGQAENVEKAFNDYKDYLVNEAMNYPMNLGKVQGATVYKNGDYVFFIMLGAFDEESQTEEDAKKFAEAQNQIAVDAIDELLK